VQDNDPLEQRIDSVLQEFYKPDEPGAAVIVVKDGKVIFRKGYGMANLELGVPIEPDMVFRLGSITKQFTAVAMLQLVEQGKVAPDDLVTKFLPDYPTYGHPITIKHLLAHTSGIKSHTSMPEMWASMRKDLSVQELIDFFKYQPMNFIPDTQWAYNNSGYLILGAIIEKVSGQTYEEFLQTSIFSPLGMKQSYYDSTSQIIHRRVAGYDKNKDGFVNAAYISMTQPYGAGALASTVDDLAIWDAALYTNKIIEQETLQQAFVSHKLADGTSTMYGYGWFLSEYGGRQFIEHSGGIPGFSTYAIRVPDDRVFVAILSNNSGFNPGILAFKITSIAIEQPYSDPEAIELQVEDLALYEGLYEVSPSEMVQIKREENQLFYQYNENPRREITPISHKEFFFKVNSTNRIFFKIDENNVVTEFEMRGRVGIPEKAKRVTDRTAQTNASTLNP